MAGAERRRSAIAEQPLWQLALVEGAFVAIAALIIFVRHSAAAIVFRMPLPAEAAIGLAVGAALGSLLGIGLLRSPLRGPVVDGVLPLRAVASAGWSIVVLGLAAGVGEELLFRAALQPWIGLGWAAALFGLAHSGTARLHEGLSPGKVAYLLSAVAAGVLLGRLYQSAGLLATMTAHASFDIGILLAPAIVSTTPTAGPA